MKRSHCLSTLVAVVLVAVLSCLLAGPASAEVKVGDRAVDFVAVKDGKGRKLKLQKYRGKIVVLTFGASWCKPCKAELPAWDKLARAYKDKGVVFIAVTIDKEEAKGKEFVKKAKLKAVVAGFEPGGGTVESYEPPTMPSTFVIGKKGVVRHLHRGYRAGDEKALAKELDKLLAK